MSIMAAKSIPFQRSPRLEYHWSFCPIFVNIVKLASTVEYFSNQSLDCKVLVMVILILQSTA